MTGDCSQGGHFGYAYFVAHCAPMLLEATYCPGSDTAIVAAPEGFASYLWNNGTTTRTDTIIPPKEDSTFSCVLTSVTGCQATLHTIMKVSILNSDFEHDSCTNTVSFSNLSTLNIGAFTYLWDFGDGTLSTEKNPIHVYPAAGTYTATLIASSALVGCPDTTTKNINVILDLNAHSDSICAQSTVLLLASTTAPNAMLAWYQDVGYSTLIIEKDSLQTTTLITDTVFYLEVSKDNCKLRDTITVTVYPLPNLPVANIAVCYDSTAILTVPVMQSVSLTWYSDSLYSNIIVHAPSFETSKLRADTVFYVEALSVEGCISRDTIRVAVYPLPDLTVNPIAVCYDSMAVLTASSVHAVLLTWYSDANYTNIITHAASFTTTTLQNDTAFYIEALSVDGCISRDTVRVSLYPLPDLSVRDTAVCYGSTIALTASSRDSVTFTWYSDANYTTILIHAASFTTSALQADTVFYIEALSVDGCISRDTVRVTVYPLPDLSVRDTAVCYGETIILTASSTNAISFTWYSDASYTTILVHAASFATAVLTIDTTFYIEALSADGCISRDTVRITVYPLPDLSVYDTAVCYASTVTLTTLSKDAVSLTWYSDVNYTNIIVNAASFTTSALEDDTVFYIEALSADGCILRDTVRVSLYPLPDLSVRDTIVCYASNVELTALSRDVVSFRWYSDAAHTNLIGQGASLQTNVLLTDTKFYPEALSANGCITDSVIVVSVLPPLTFSSVITSDTCDKSTGKIELMITSAYPATVVCTWEGLSDTGRVLLGLEGNKTYSVVITDTFCSTSGVFFVPMISRPTADFTVSAYFLTVGSQLILTDVSKGSIFTRDWDFGDGTTNNATHTNQIVFHTYMNSGYYLVSLKIMDINDCMDTITNNIYVYEDIGVYIPTIFTPNGDGVNDTWGPIMSSFLTEGYSLSVFDRWGATVFLSTIPLKMWDGTVHGKQAQGNTVYTYRLIVRDILNVEHEYVGRVSMIR
jgi:gliding motility-associated-like protein